MSPRKAFRFYLDWHWRLRGTGDWSCALTSDIHRCDCQEMLDSQSPSSHEWKSQLGFTDILKSGAKPLEHESVYYGRHTKQYSMCKDIQSNTKARAGIKARVGTKARLGIKATVRTKSWLRTKATIRTKDGVGTKATVRNKARLRTKAIVRTKARVGIKARLGIKVGQE